MILFCLPSLSYSSHHQCCRFDGVAVITSALHAEGREFKPRSNLFFAMLLPDVANESIMLSYLELQTSTRFYFHV